MIYKREYINLGKDSEQWFISSRAAEAYPFASVLFKEGGYCLLDKDFWIERPKAKGYSTMVITLSGEGEFRQEDGTVFTLKEGEMFISSPESQGHREASKGDGVWEQIWLTFYASSSILPSEEFDCKIIGISETALIRELMLCIIREDFHPSTEGSMATELAENLLILTLRRMLQIPQSREKAKVRADFEKLWNEVSSTLNQDWSIERMCRTLNYSRSQLTRLCNELYGESPGAKIRRMRMESAKLLLSNSSMTIFEIADSVGYSSPSLFSSSFYSYTGKSPREYRKEKRNLIKENTSAFQDQNITISK